MPIWQLCANMLIPNCLRSNLSYSPLAALELYVKNTIPKRLQRIQKDLRRTSGKSRMTHDEALAEIIEMAKKYSAYYMAQESQLNEQETNAEIILSESFK